MYWTCRNINTIPREALEKVYEHLSPSRKEHIDRLRLEPDKRRSLAAQWLLQQLLEETCGIADATLHRGSNGQPYLTGCDLFVSLSHCDDMVACAVSEEPVGIDIEPVRPLRRELETKLLADGELAECRLLSDEAAGQYLLRKWCEKESVFKLGNEALYRPRTVTPGELARVVTAQLPDGAYCLAVASRSPEAMMLKSHWDLAQLREIYGGEMPNPGNL
jgi:4'-phosphopantetheinyl transferase